MRKVDKVFVRIFFKNNNIHLNIVSNNVTFFNSSTGKKNNFNNWLVKESAKIKAVIYKFNDPYIIFVVKGHVSPVGQFFIIQLGSLLKVQFLFFIKRLAFNGCRLKKMRRVLFGQMSERFMVLVLKTS